MWTRWSTRVDDKYMLRYCKGNKSFASKKPRRVINVIFAKDGQTPNDEKYCLKSVICDTKINESIFLSHDIYRHIEQPYLTPDPFPLHSSPPPSSLEHLFDALALPGHLAVLWTQDLLTRRTCLKRSPN